MEKTPIGAAAKGQNNNVTSGFLEFVRDRGRITPEQFEALRAMQSSRHYFGVLALREGYVTPDDLERALLEQNRLKSQEKIGSIMMRMKLMSDAQVNDVLDKQKNSAESIGRFLVDFDMLSQEELDEAIENFETQAERQNSSR